MKLKKPARAIQRVVAVTGDLALTYLLTSILRALGHYESFYNPIYNLLLAVAGRDLAADFSLLLYYYLIYFILRFYTTIIFGVTFSQFVIGLRVKGGKKFIRIGGAFRVIVEFLTTPLIFFDLPALKRKRTTKELLSFTAIESIENLVVVSIGGGITLLFYLLAIWSPILEVVKVSADISSQFNSKQGEYISKKSDFRKFTSYSSNHFKMVTFSSLDHNRYILIPGFEIRKLKSGRSIRPYLRIYDKISKVEGMLRIERKLKLLKVLKIAEKGNPFFSYKYPALASRFFLNIDKFKPRDLLEDKEISSLIDETGKKEITSLVISSLTLDIGSVFKYIISNGPFIRGAVLLRNRLLNISSLSELTMVSIDSFGSSSFLRFTRHLNINSFGVPGGFSAKVVENYLPLHSNNVPVLQLIWEKSGDGLKSLKDFKNVFLSSSEWYFDYDTNFPLPANVDDMRVTHVLDYINSKEINEKRRELLYNYLYKYMFDICKGALISEDQKLQKIMILQLNRVSDVVRFEKNRKKKLDQDVQNDIKFLGFSRSLVEALQNRDREYFK